jgi:hypothetical protein
MRQHQPCGERRRWYAVPVKRAYRVVGVLLVASGVVGFARPTFLAPFAVTWLHHVLHLGAGVVALGAASRGIGDMRAVGKGLGAFFLFVAVLGFLVPGTSAPHNLLHLALAAFFFYYSLLAPPIP